MVRLAGPVTQNKSQATVLGCGTFVTEFGIVQGEPMRGAAQTIKGRRDGDVTTGQIQAQKYFLAFD